MEYTDQDVRAAYCPDMLALSAKFDEWNKDNGNGNRKLSRVMAFFEIAQQVYGISEVQFMRAQEIRAEIASGVANV